MGIHVYRNQLFHDNVASHIHFYNGDIISATSNYHIEICILPYMQHILIAVGKQWCLCA